MKKEELTKMTKEELEELKRQIEEELARRQTKKYELHLFYNRYKGTGKAWIARVNEYKKIVGFVDAESVIRDGYKGEKVYLLGDGKYLACQAGSKTRDDREYFIIENGEKKEWGEAK